MTTLSAVAMGISEELSWMLSEDWRYTLEANSPYDPCAILRFENHSSLRRVASYYYRSYVRISIVVYPTFVTVMYSTEPFRFDYSDPNCFDRLAELFMSLVLHVEKMASSLPNISVEGGVTPMSRIWIGGPNDIRTDGAADAALRLINDRDFFGERGIVRVSHERWLVAQAYEASAWPAWEGVTDSRSLEHRQKFASYKNVPKSLGATIEFGCGPFPRLRDVLAKREASRSVLLDPLVERFAAECPTCP